MTLDFRQILSQKIDDVKAPVPLPAGSYKGIIVKHEYGESTQKKTPFLRYTVRVLEAMADVDPELIEGQDLTKKTLRSDFYLTPDSLFRVKDFWTALGINTEGRSIGELAPEAMNAIVLLSVTTREGQNGPGFNDVRDMKAVSTED